MAVRLAAQTAASWAAETAEQREFSTVARKVDCSDNWTVDSMEHWWVVALADQKVRLWAVT